MTAMDSMWQNMFSLGDMSVWEKSLRTVCVYLGIVVAIRVFGKRLMSQLNSLDLVVVLLLSNVVQNAIIGSDNSVTGGLLGALVLVVFNALLDRFEHRVPWLRWIAEGKAAVVVRDGEIQEDVVRRLGLTDADLNTALRHQGADSVAEVEMAEIEPGGDITVDLKRSDQAVSFGELSAAMDSLRAHLDARLDDLVGVAPTPAPSPAAES